MTNKIWILLAVAGSFYFSSCNNKRVCCREPESLAFQYLSTERVDLLDHRKTASKYYYYDIWIEDIVKEGNTEKSEISCRKGQMGDYDQLANTKTDSFKYIVYGYNYSRYGKNLLYTLIHLNDTEIDTVRFVHTGKFGNYCPDTVYYNSKGVVVKTPLGSSFHYCTVSIHPSTYC